MKSLFLIVSFCITILSGNLFAQTKVIDIWQGNDLMLH
jgi:hypothetical protein